MNYKENINNNNHFNSFLAEQATSLIDNHPYQAKAKLEEYIKNYPTDYTIYPYYANLLIKIGLFDEAKTALDCAKKQAESDQIFLKNERRKKYLKDYILSTYVKLLICTGNLEECLNLLITEEIEGVDKTNVKFYVRKHLGLYDPTRREPNGYLFRQIVRYEEADFKNHIKKHMVQYQTTEDQNQNVFREDFPINQVIEEIKKYIPSQKAMFESFYTNTYIFKYNSCGTENYRNADFIKVVVLHGTNEFITMLPIKEGEDFPYIDLNYMIPENDKPIQRRLSQTEKFELKFQKFKRN